MQVAGTLERTLKAGGWNARPVVFVGWMLDWWLVVVDLVLDAWLLAGCCGAC